MKNIAFALVIITFVSSCSPFRPLAKQARKNIFKQNGLTTAHTGISIYEPATGRYWFNHQGDKYFVPGSNVKIATSYAVMKYLGDSLKGIKYGLSEEEDTSNTVLALQPTGDPTFLHPDFSHQPVMDFLLQKAPGFNDAVVLLDTAWKDQRWGKGWAWEDYNAGYMPERNSFPVYGNVIDIQLNALQERGIKENSFPDNSPVHLFKTRHRLFDSLLNSNSNLIANENLLSEQPNLRITRELSDNEFSLEETKIPFKNTSIPFVTYGNATAAWLVSDTLKTRFGYILNWGTDPGKDHYFYACPECSVRKIKISKWFTINSQPTDSLLRPMMHRSDNLFAEQSLLMVSNGLLGVMNDEQVIDTLLKTDFKDIPQKPRWVDGCGLSRYNLFTPLDFIYFLNKLKNDFGMERIKNIFPTGGQGTLSNYFEKDAGFIFAKTGSLSGIITLSGYLYTQKNKLLLFSVLINNHQASGTGVRRAVEKFLQSVREKY